jgi:hypothetical protein
MPTAPRRVGTAVLVAAVFLVAAFAPSAPPAEKVIASFSLEDPGSGLPAGWEAIPMQGEDRPTRYRLVRLDSTVVLRARSENSASGLATRRAVDLEEHPVLEWRWRVDGVLEDGNLRTKAGDDAPARIYVLFDYDDLGLADRLKRLAMRAFGYDDVPTRAINYVWSSRVPEGTTLPNAYIDWIRTVPVESGGERAGTWVRERRDVLADYRCIYGTDPPPVRGVAIATDTDNTDASVTAYYGDIAFRER